MATDGKDPGSREAELLRVLGEQTAPKPVSWLSALGLSLGGGAVIGLMVANVGSMTGKPKVELEREVPRELSSAAVSAYKQADWDAAERLFTSLAERFPDHMRARDYQDRIELTRRDAEVLARAEEALAAGVPERARTLAARVAPNSPLFAQAEGLSRSARAQEMPDGSPDPSPIKAEVKGALGEAMALYENAEFEDAASRAKLLAERGRGVVQAQLSRWANEAVMFGRIYVSLSAPGADLLGRWAELQTAVALDERLSDGHYARALRARGAKALLGRAALSARNGQLENACADLAKARAFSPQHGTNPALERSCDGLRRPAAGSSTRDPGSGASASGTP